MLEMMMARPLSAPNSWLGAYISIIQEKWTAVINGFAFFKGQVRTDLGIIYDLTLSAYEETFVECFWDASNGADVATAKSLVGCLTSIMGGAVRALVDFGCNGQGVSFLSTPVRGTARNFQGRDPGCGFDGECV